LGSAERQLLDIFKQAKAAEHELAERQLASMLALVADSGEHNDSGYGRKASEFVQRS
jgi:hypothetical protein